MNAKLLIDVPEYNLKQGDSVKLIDHFSKTFKTKYDYYDFARKTKYVYITNERHDFYYKINESDLDLFDVYTVIYKSKDNTISYQFAKVIDIYQDIIILKINNKLIKSDGIILKNYDKNLPYILSILSNDEQYELLTKLTNN